MTKYTYDKAGSRYKEDQNPQLSLRLFRSTSAFFLVLFLHFSLLPLLLDGCCLLAFATGVLSCYMALAYSAAVQHIAHDCAWQLPSYSTAARPAVMHTVRCLSHSEVYKDRISRFWLPIQITYITTHSTCLVPQTLLLLLLLLLILMLLNRLRSSRT